MLYKLIVISIKAIGALLVFAMIVTPAAAAYQWSYKFNKIIYLSIIFGMISSFIGLYFSFVYDLPSGSCICITVSIIFLFSMLLSPKHRTGKATGFQHAETCEVCIRQNAKFALKLDTIKQIKKNVNIRGF